MAKKEIVTPEDIEKDIITALKNPSEMSKVSHKRTVVIAIILSVILIIIEFIYPIFIVWLLLALVVLLIGGSIFYHFRLKSKINRISIDDYYISTETVNNIDEEHYKVDRGIMKRRRIETVSNYTICFENGKSWRIPKDNYLWCEKRPMSDFAIYQSSHCGDVFIVVVKKDTGEIAMAYNTEFFEYKKRRLSYE